MGPFHSLFLPLGLSPAFLSPTIGWGLCPNARSLQRACSGPASAWLPTCSLPAGSPLLLQRLGSSPTWHSACIAFPHDVSLTPTCASVPGLILLHPLPRVLATRTSALYRLVSLAKPTFVANPVHLLPLALPPGPQSHCAPQLSVTSVASSLLVPVGQSLLGSSSPVGLISRV